jgi:glycylpeptide N-tetradecanoyltransferase
MPPGYLPEWHVGVRMEVGKKKKKNKLVGFITGVPANVQTGQSIMPMCEINFLCCWKKLRGKRLAPLLIKEVQCTMMQPAAALSKAIGR